MANNLEMPAELTLEQKRDQLIEKADKLHQEKMEMIADNLKAEDPILRAKQEEIDRNFEEIEATRAQIESAEAPVSPEVITAGKIVEAKFDDLERGIAEQNKKSQEKLIQLDAENVQLEEKLNAIVDKNGNEFKNLTLDRMKNRIVAENIRKGLKLEEERGLKMAA